MGAITRRSLLRKTALWGMGANWDGQLGIGNTTAQLTPVQIVSSGVTQARHSHALFLKEDGSLWAMGDMQAGQLGGGAIVDQSSPIQILNSGVAQLQQVTITRFY